MTKPHAQSESASPRYLMGYATLRWFVGVIGVLLPFVIVLLDLNKAALLDIGSAISAYYYATNAVSSGWLSHLPDSRDWLVGSLCAIAVFLITYRGPEGEDHAFCLIAGVCAAGIALFPTVPPDYLPGRFPDPDRMCDAACQAVEAIGEALHLISAIGFFAMIIILVAFRFTRTRAQPAYGPSVVRYVLASVIGRTGGRERPERDHGATPLRRIENAIYYLCAFVMIASLVPIAWAEAIVEATGVLSFVAWAEAFAIWAFGFAWLVKGGLLRLFSAEGES